jgi:hypothetical protein
VDAQVRQLKAAVAERVWRETARQPEALTCGRSSFLQRF